jgi:hypothetical protein
MMPGPDLADLVGYAATRGGVILAGDTSQLNQCPAHVLAHPAQGPLLPLASGN